MDFQKLLLDAGKALSKDEVKALAFLCTDLLGRSTTSVELASDIFSRLTDQDRLSPEQPHLLTELLLIIQRPRLVRDLGLNVSITESLISPYRKLLYDLSEDITDEDLKQVKFLLNKQLPRRKLDENVTTLEVFQEMEHKDLINSTNLSVLKNIIESVCPILKEKINRFEEVQERFSGPIAQETGEPMSVSYPSEQNQVPQSFNSESTASGERPDLTNVVHGGDDCEDLSHGLRELSTRTSNYDSSEARSDAIEISLSQEDKTSAKPKTFRHIQFQTANTNNEDLGTYRMNSAKRGICLIINNYNFSKSKVALRMREGTIIDERNLNSVFEWLGFEVEIRRDCKREDMLSVIQDLARRNHSQMDCLVCCVLSHGLEQSVYGVDGLTVELKELMEPFNGSRCSSLVTKPKLFFIQACQGTQEQAAVYIESDGPTAQRSNQQPSLTIRQPEPKISIPCNADFLLGVATVPSFVSFRERKHGTWFIQSLCQNLVRMVPSGSDIVSVLTKVNADVSQRTDITGEKKQMPQPAFTLRNKVVFPIPSAPPPSLQP